MSDDSSSPQHSPQQPEKPTANSLQGWVFLSLIAMGSLVGVTGMRQFFFDPIDNAGTNAAWFVVQLIPLLVPLPGFLRGGLTSTFILCLASMLYFIHGVMLAFHPDLAWLGYAEVFFALGLTFTTALLTRKIRQQQAR